VLALLPWLPDVRATLGFDDAAVATCRRIAAAGAACAYSGHRDHPDRPIVIA